MCLAAPKTARSGRLCTILLDMVLDAVYSGLDRQTRGQWRAIIAGFCFEFLPLAVGCIMPVTNGARIPLAKMTDVTG